MKRPSNSRPLFADAANSVRVVRFGGKFTPGVLWILGLYTLTYVLLQVPRVGEFIGDYLMLRPAQALGAQPYQLLTGPLLMTSFFSLLFFGVLLWSVGSAIEQQLGTRRFLLWAGLSSLAASLAAAALGRILPAQGLLPVVLDANAVSLLVLTAFSQFYGAQQVTMWGIGQPMSGRTLSYFFIGLWLVSDALAQRWTALGGAAAAVLCTLLLCRGGRGLSDSLTRLFRRRQRPPRGMQVIDGGRAGSPPRGSTHGSDEPRWLN